MKKIQGQPLPLGVTVTEDRINFSVVVSGEKKCRLLLYREKEGGPCITFDMEESLGDVRYLALKIGRAHV